MSAKIEAIDIWKRIDSASYLFLDRLYEPRDNALTIILQEAVASESKRGPRTIAGITLDGYAPIEPGPGCSIFTLHWKLYVSYCVTEEMHGSCGKYEDEEYTGRLLREYSKSHFLEFTAKDTGAHSDPYRHFKIACLNHNIDIVATQLPELAILSREEFGVLRASLKRPAIH
jgi:hypothetical protein